MKKINFIIVLTILSSLFLISCQKIKDGLTGRKSENSDEFLVQKKNPLVMPPDYMKLPKPDESEEPEESAIEKETDIQKLLKMDKSDNKISKNKFGNAEEFVLKNLKK